jgi:hypothetical protein
MEARCSPPKGSIGPAYTSHSLTARGGPKNEQTNQCPEPAPQCAQWMSTKLRIAFANMRTASTIIRLMFAEPNSCE